MAAVIAASGIAIANEASGQVADTTRIVDSRAAVVRFNAGTYTFDESAGTVTNQISLIARTPPNSIPPLRGFSVRVSTRAHSASSGDDYGKFSRRVTFSGGFGNWVDVGNAYESEVRLAVRIVGDHLDEDDETFGLLLSAGNDPLSTIGIAPADLAAASRCTSDGCESLVTIVDDDIRGVTIGHTGILGVPEGGDAEYSVMLDSQPTGDVTVTPEVRDATDADVSVSRALTFTPHDWDRPQMVTVSAATDKNRLDGSAMVTHAVSGADYESNLVTAPSVSVVEQDAGRDAVVVTITQIPEGTVLPDRLSSSQGQIVEDGSTFIEGGLALFRLLLSAADGGPPPGGANVELSYTWHNESPIVPISGQHSRGVLGLGRVSHWDAAVQILDNDVGNPDGTLTIRITGCERNGCVIGEPSEITVTIADDDGGPEAVPTG